MNCSLDGYSRGLQGSQEHLQLGSKASIARLFVLARKGNEGTKTASEVFAIREAIGGNVSAATDLEPPSRQLNRRPLSSEVGACVEIICGPFCEVRSSDCLPPSAACMWLKSPVVKGGHPINGCPRRASCSYQAVRRALRWFSGRLRREMPARIDSVPRSAGGCQLWRRYPRPGRRDPGPRGPVASVSMD